MAHIDLLTPATQAATSRPHDLRRLLATTNDRESDPAPSIGDSGDSSGGRSGGAAAAATLLPPSSQVHPAATGGDPSSLVSTTQVATDTIALETAIRTHPASPEGTSSPPTTDDVVSSASGPGLKTKQQCATIGAIGSSDGFDGCVDVDEQQPTWKDDIVVGMSTREKAADRQQPNRQPLPKPQQQEQDVVSSTCTSSDRARGIRGCGGTHVGSAEGGTSAETALAAASSIVGAPPEALTAVRTQPAVAAGSFTVLARCSRPVMMRRPEPLHLQSRGWLSWLFLWPWDAAWAAIRGAIEALGIVRPLLAADTHISIR
jgi:hypothetical protein